MWYLNLPRFCLFTLAKKTQQRSKKDSDDLGDADADDNEGFVCLSCFHYVYVDCGVLFTFSDIFAK